MKEFFEIMHKKGIKILLAVLIIWFLYFLINFFSPHFFDFFRNEKEAEQISNQNSISWSQKIYNTFFNNHIFDFNTYKNNTNTSSSSDRQSGWGDDYSSSVWGYEGQNAIDFDSINNKNVFVYMNTQNSPIQNMKINNILVNKNVYSVLEDGSIITGAIFTGYNDSYYFDIEIYNATGQKMFSIPTNSPLDLKNKDIHNFMGVYRKAYNIENYIGDGFLVIRSDNSNVEGMNIIKIKIR